MTRIKNWTKMSPKELWEAWRAQFQSRDEAIIEAVWTANRLVKARAKSTRRQFYDIKDEFIRRSQKHHLVGGQKVRKERSFCHRCSLGRAFEFCGFPLPDDAKDQGLRGCHRCNGSGIYKSRWLYVHRFDFNGRHYSFHSYQEPTRVSGGRGEDLEKYGGRFTEDELAELALPVTGLIRVLGYIATTEWGMKRRDGRYFKPARLA